jgi:hypothetical protein
MTEEISMKNTKKELLDIINKMQSEMASKEENKLNPEKVKTETRAKETLKKAEEISESDLGAQIHTLKMAINKELSAMADKIASEANKYITLQESIRLKQSEIEEIYGIEKQAASLAVLLESQNQAREEFEAEMGLKREKLDKEIADSKAVWEFEKKSFKETMAEEKRKIEQERQREEEEYSYNKQRSRALEENAFADKIAALEKEISEKKDSLDKQVKEKTTALEEREREILDREKQMNQLEIQVERFPKELEEAVTKAIATKEKELTANFNQQKELLTKGFEGELRVLEAKITSLEATVKDQVKQIDKLGSQQEKAYQQVQNIAEKAVAGAAERSRSVQVRTSEKDETGS